MGFDAAMRDTFVFLAQGKPASPTLPDKPPDWGDPAGLKVSFRDKMLADRQPAPVREEIDLLAQGTPMLVEQVAETTMVNVPPLLG
ncbi:unnamed protein product [Lupinus luteus]|uniref:Uncharacterized protein n=1 Tax=Lupinus luteus TaxID=3873 RepID=A0AAV1WC29_LUPLU